MQVVEREYGLPSVDGTRPYTKVTIINDYGSTITTMNRDQAIELHRKLGAFLVGTTDRPSR